MSQITFDSFQLNFVDDSISIIIPEDPKEQDLNSINLQEELDKLELSVNDSNQSKMTGSSLEIDAHASTSNSHHSRSVELDNNDIIEEAVNRSQSVLSSFADSNGHVSISIPNHSDNDISQLLDLNPSQFNDRLQSYIHVYDQPTDILEDVYKEIELTEKHLADKKAQIKENPFYSQFPLHVTEINISKQHILECSLEAYSCLERLDASHNELNSIQLPNSILTLILHHNNFTTYSFIDELPQLESLDMDHNDCTDFIAHSKLSHISLNYNQVEHIPSISMNNLKHLSINHNKIASIDFISSFKQLATLSISHNELKSLSNLNDIVELNCSHNAITHIPKYSATLCIKLLNASHNQLNSFDGSLFPSLHHCDLSFNNINHIKHCDSTTLVLNEQSCKKMTLVESINSLYFFAQNNKLVNKSLLNPNLVELHLVRCHINRISSYTVNKFIHLKVLNLNYNNITHVASLSHLSQLESLYLVGNRIKSFTMVLTLLQNSLKVLDLRQNSLTATYYPTTMEDFKNKDDIYLKQVNDAVYVQRLCYRASIIYKSDLSKLDGLEITTQDKESAQMILSKLKTLNKYRI